MERRTFIQKSVALAGGMLAANSTFAREDSVILGKRIGIIGLDTSHSEVFTKIINNNLIDSQGFKVVAAYADGSRDIPSALKMKPAVTNAVRQMGVEIVDTIDDLLGKVDVLLLESNDGRVHLNQAMPVFKAGKPVFIDKPLAANLKQADEIFRLAAVWHTPVFTSSALRFEKNVQSITNGTIGEVTGADVYVPADIDPGHLDLAWYAIHGVEMLFTVLGPDCRSVSRVYSEGTDLVIGQWENGAIGTLRGIRKGASGIAGTAFGSRGIAKLGPFETYNPLVEQIIMFFQTGKPPVAAADTIAMFRFMEAADLSKGRGGKPVTLSDL
ncbi:gfo/Idh/MocA family oxidoreductase [Dyadobacter luteus]|jgi:predicted dehydrogenase|uniref:Gfo/Idh/MocA family oxidoreductase n=1 Tax=Dyadobacter luteus TaxID=2259619 RepID=A0A3D8YGD2_9BACT|nr:Gfo/Idh/MocA family oxidoreductase [Dyadobacter luteus]REA63614.1 gfo/Idh/MocA family oxidoreductase [Dyadobacter luteus]